VTTPNLSREFERVSVPVTKQFGGDPVANGKSGFQRRSKQVVATWSADSADHIPHRFAVMTNDRYQIPVFLPFPFPMIAVHSSGSSRFTISDSQNLLFVICHHRETVPWHGKS
jgi:hypothetical protein